MGEIVDLRDGYRIEVAPTIMPQGEFSATFHRRRYTQGGRTAWKRVGPHVLNADPEKAANDLLLAINQGVVPDVEFRSGRASASHPDRASTSPTTRAGEATETKQKEKPR